MSNKSRGISVGITVGIILFFSCIGIIENLPGNDLFWIFNHNNDALQQSVVELAVETGDINILILISSSFIFVFFIGVFVVFVVGIIGDDDFASVSIVVLIGGVVVYIVGGVVGGVVGTAFVVGGVVGIVIGIVGIYVASRVEYATVGSSFLSSIFLTLILLIGISVARGFRFSTPSTPLEATIIALERDIQYQQDNLTATAEQYVHNREVINESLTQTAEVAQTNQSFNATRQALEATQTALSSQARGVPIPPSLTPPATSTESPIATNAPVPTPDILSTDQAQLDILNATATVQAIDVSTQTEDSNTFFLIEWLRDPIFQGLSFILAVFGAFIKWRKKGA